MTTAKVSVVIPAYNGGDHLGEALRSVLKQTYQNFEIIIIDDASPEPMSDVIMRFDDARIHYIRHEQNQGAVAARQTGVHASSGDFIALLDQDDLFHSQKLELHVAFMQEHPEVGVTYNARFEMMGSVEKICGLWQPPRAVTLADWVLGFPISPSDTVLRREWAVRDEIWDDSFASQAEHVIFNGQEIVFGGRLTLAGCKFGNVGKALNYRRYHPRRVLKHLDSRCKAERACQEIIFNDSRCPREVVTLRDIAFSNIYVMWAYVAYLQGEFSLGQDFLRKAIQLKPSLIYGEPCELLNSWVAWATMGTSDYERTHDSILQSILNNLPQGFERLKEDYEWAVARGYLLKGLHQLVWSRLLEAQEYLKKAKELGADVDELSMQMLVRELLDYEAEFGSLATQRIISSIELSLDQLGNQDSTRLLKGIFAANQAFRNYQACNFAEVPGDILVAVRNNPKYLANKGILSVLARSLAWRMGLSN